MNFFRMVLCALSAFLVGCASGSNPAYSPAYHDFPAGTTVRTQSPVAALAYVAPVYLPTTVSSSQPAYLAASPTTTYAPPVVAAPVYGAVAENGSYYGQPNVNGVPKTVAVNGYYRKDGTYVRGYYRSPPGSNPPSTRRRR